MIHFFTTVAETIKAPGPLPRFLQIPQCVRCSAHHCAVGPCVWFDQVAELIPKIATRQPGYQDPQVPFPPTLDLECC